MDLVVSTPRCPEISTQSPAKDWRYLDTSPVDASTPPSSLKRSNFWWREGGKDEDGIYLTLVKSTQPIHFDTKAMTRLFNEVVVPAMSSFPSFFHTGADGLQEFIDNTVQCILSSNHSEYQKQVAALIVNTHSFGPNELYYQHRYLQLIWEEVERIRQVVPSSENTVEEIREALEGIYLESRTAVLNHGYQLPPL